MISCSEIPSNPQNPSYIITYDGNGNTGGKVPPIQTKNHEVALTLASNTGDLEKDGYTFAGWNTEADGSGTDYAVGASYTVDKDVTLYAKWTTLPTFTITYDGNGNTDGNVPSAQTKIQGVALILASNTGSLVKTGYAFAGWNTMADGSGTNYAEGASYTADNNVILYVQWEIWKNLLPPVILSQSTDTSINAGNSLTFSVKASGIGLKYQWQRNRINIPGAITSIYRIDTVKQYDSSANFRCIVSNTAGSDTSNMALLHVVSFSAVSTNGYHTMILMTDGTLWATGRNEYGQLGDGTTTDKHTPVKILSDVSSVFAGGYHTMIIKTDATLWTTGHNKYGQLGDGTTTDKHIPLKILSGVFSVSAGGRHTMIIKTDGTLWATGYNRVGQLGDGTTTDKNAPVNVLSEVSSVSVGGLHTMILKTDNNIWATGSNYSGQLGDGTTTNKHTPVKTLSDAPSVYAGGYHTMILKTDGTLWATGSNSYGQLGNDTTTDKHTPENVLSNVSSVSAGWYHTMIVKKDGTLWATGWNGNGQLGDGTTTDKNTPENVLSNVSSVSAGLHHTMIIKTDGTLWATGDNKYGQLGDGTTINRSVPVLIRF